MVSRWLNSQYLSKEKPNQNRDDYTYYNNGDCDSKKGGCLYHVNQQMNINISDTHSSE